MSSPRTRVLCRDSTPRGRADSLTVVHTSLLDGGRQERHEEEYYVPRVNPHNVHPGPEVASRQRPGTRLSTPPRIPRLCFRPHTRETGARGSAPRRAYVHPAPLVQPSDSGVPFGPSADGRDSHRTRYRFQMRSSFALFFSFFFYQCISMDVLTNEK